jgi:hypothetical protein
VRRRPGTGNACLLLVLALACLGIGCTKSQIVTYSQPDGKLYLIDKATYSQTELSDLSSFSIDDGSALTFITRDTFYLHRGTDTTLFRGDITDPASPVVTALGTCPSCGGGMAQCKDGVLYSVTGEPISNLYIIDPVTLDSTFVGSLGIYTGTLGLTCEPTTDELYVFGGNVDALYTVNKTTGQATLKGPAGIDVQGGVGLEFDPLPPNTLYASVSLTGGPDYTLYSIDPATGTATFLSNLAHGNKNIGARIIEEEEE